VSNPWVGKALRGGKAAPPVPEESDDDMKGSWGAKLDSFLAPEKTAGGDTTPVAAPAPAKPAAAEKAPAQKAAPATAPAAAAASAAASSSEPMAIQVTLDSLMTLDGALCAALVDSGSGMILGQSGSGINMDIAAGGATEAVRAKLATMSLLALTDTIDDMIITLSTQHHIVRPLTRNPKVFLYLIVNKAQSNLAMARYKVTEYDGRLVL
jgi:hypothetical protein